MSLPDAQRGPEGARGEGRIGFIVALLLLVLCAVPVIAQHRGSGSGSAANTGMQQPYAGQQSREVASLGDEQLAGLRAGRGLGFALPAELSGRYPGPMHVLELADKLALTTEQRTVVQRSFEAMQAKAIAAGSAYIEAEKAVDAAFNAGLANGSGWQELVKAAELARADVRVSHLAAHVETAAVLTAEQRQHYAKLRGSAK